MPLQFHGGSVSALGVEEWWETSDSCTVTAFSSLLIPGHSLCVKDCEEAPT